MSRTELEERIAVLHVLADMSMCREQYEPIRAAIEKADATLAAMEKGDG